MTPKSVLLTDAFKGLGTSPTGSVPNAGDRWGIQPSGFVLMLSIAQSILPEHPLIWSLGTGALL